MDTVKQQSFEVLMDVFFGYLKQFGRSEKTVKHYGWRFRKLKAYMDAHNIPCYDERVGQAYLESVLGQFDYRVLSQSQKIFVNAIRILAEFQHTGAIRFGTSKQPPKVFTGQTGMTMVDFMTYRREMFSLSESTLKGYAVCLSGLLAFLDRTGVTNTDEITETVIIRYAGSFDPDKASLKERALQLTKNYLKYLYESKLSRKDFSGLIPRCNYTHRAKLPSTFTTDEIKALLAAVDRGSPKGKRDYAILLLATKLGLRSSDIRWLRFGQLHWKQNTIEIKQQKTGRTVTLPLLPEVGNAIIDYLRHGRPDSTESHIFLQARPPYKHLDRCAIGGMVSSHLRRAGINCSNRKHGPHALRHSFAGTLLSKKTPLPVISEALGHGSTESTMNYLRIDAGMLRQCALEVPEVPPLFYRNERGGLYHG